MNLKCGIEWWYVNILSTIDGAPILFYREVSGPDSISLTIIPVKLV